MMLPIRPIRPAIKFIQKTLGDNLVGAEIGVWMGRHSYEINHYLKIKILYVVDNWLRHYRGTIKSGNKKIKINGPKAYKLAWRKLHNLPQMRFIKKPSHKAAQYVEDGSLDFVYIDADHSYEAAMRDIKVWRKKVRKGGIVAGHDFGYRRTPGVTKAVMHFIHRRNILCYYQPHDWWFINE
jgi:hypothetical protein